MPITVSDFLLDRYSGQFTLTDVFRHVLRVTCDKFAPGSSSGGYGAGISTARRVLLTPLPTAADLRSTRPRAAVGLAVATPVDTIAAVFPEVPRELLRQRLAALLHAPDEELDARLAGVEQELVFQIVTDPQLRAQLAGAPAQAEGAPSALGRARLRRLRWRARPCRSGCAHGWSRGVERYQIYCGRI